MKHLNILVYATTLGADLLSTVRYLEEKQEVRLKILLDDPESFINEPITRLKPVRSELVKNNTFRSLFGIRRFKPDITIMDNRLPLRRTSEKALVLWHGFGWKGPNDEEEFKWLHRQIRNLWGDAKVPNPDFVWQCFGPWDYEHRTRISGFHPDNCRILGAASHDELIHPVDRKTADPYYPFDVVNRKTVLIAPTWHYGEVFSHWGGDRKIMTRLLEFIHNENANVILRLHDSYRFDKSYIIWLESLKSRYPNLMLKFKDRHPDNFLDMQVSDMLITNFSSIANLFYATGKPTIHVYPVKSGDEEFIWRQHTLIGQREKRISKAKYIWKLPPEDNGGWLARGEEELMEMTAKAIKDRNCCLEESRSFLDRHMLGADGKNRERIWQVIREMCR